MKDSSRLYRRLKQTIIEFNDLLSDASKTLEHLGNFIEKLLRALFWLGLTISHIILIAVLIVEHFDR